MALLHNAPMPPSKDNDVDVHNVPTRSVTTAVNYELSILADRKRARPDDVPNAIASAALSNVENSAPNVLCPKDPAAMPVITSERTHAEVPRPEPVGSRTPCSDQKTRRSTRGKTRDMPTLKTRVRYDMQLVPPARRNRAFLDAFPVWWMARDEASKPERHDNDSTICQRCDGPVLPPFTEDTSVLWVPKSRAEWDDCVSEMTAVCTSAEIRRYHAQGDNSKPFYPPLSGVYIRDRVDIDDPIRGCQLRHKTGGWLQGFVMYTNFTVWTLNFHWNSKHELSGLANAEPFSDADGSLARELEEQERIGDPHGEGIVFPTIAEISLVGGLGCGEYMLRAAMDDIRAAKRYKYVVLQCTEQSKTFYQRFGFVRVGAICQYGLPSVDGSPHPVMGYRHWTHANESEKSLELHGGPSYMMCLKLPDTDIEDACLNCGRSMAESNNPSFMKTILSLQVDSKPTVEQLGASFTPASKQRRGSATGVNGESLGDGQVKRGRGRPRKGQESLKTAQVTAKRKYDAKPDGSKRLKTCVPMDTVTSELALTPPRLGSQSSSPKQYPPVWSAVGLDSDASTGRARRSLHQSKAPASLSGKSEAGVGRAKSKKVAPKLTFTASPPAKLRREDGSARSLGPGRPDGKPTPIDRNNLFKQKPSSYPRQSVHYYNRVVKPVNGPKHYYLVMHYDEADRMMRIVPMKANGKLTGKSEGRPRYQVVLQETDTNIATVRADDYVIVPARMVMKTPLVANEAFDIEE